MSRILAEGRRRCRRTAQALPRAIVQSILTLVSAWRERGRVRRRLAVMSERELLDIGICRAELSDEIGRPFWREMKGRLP